MWMLRLLPWVWRRRVGPAGRRPRVWLLRRRRPQRKSEADSPADSVARVPLPPAPAYLHHLSSPTTLTLR